MLSKLRNKKKYGFTLIELLLVCSAFAILVSGVIMAINRAYSFMNNTRVRIRATNFAREGVEMMFNIRDTNRRKYSGERDKYWLYQGTGNIDKQILKQGLYTIKEGKENGNNYFYLTGSSLDLVSDNNDVDYFYSDEGFWDDQYEAQRLATKIEFDGDYTYVDVDGVEQSGSIQSLLANEIGFYRVVRVFGIYCKDSEKTDDRCDTHSCSCPLASDPKEMRFCVKVFYRHQNSKNSSELCSIMTNFME